VRAAAKIFSTLNFLPGQLVASKQREDGSGATTGQLSTFNTPSMNTRLHYIQNWPELAQEANWSAAVLAKKCGVSVRTLERHFLKQFSKTPKAWLAEQRQRKAVELLHDNSSVKETAMCLGYKHATNFTRKFKDHWGGCPVQIVQTKTVRAANVAK
jgi:transcriptional regulator GlxA family with amidase domain